MFEYTEEKYEYELIELSATATEARSGLQAQAKPQEEHAEKFEFIILYNKVTDSTRLSFE